MGIENIVEKRLGYVFSENGVYEPDEIVFTVELGARVEIGDIVCIEHPSKPGAPVFYQVFEVPLRRKARDYEEDLVRAGNPLIDESRNYPRARAKQIGYIEDVGKLLSGKVTADELLMLIEHVKPLSEVYAPKHEVIEKLLEPSAPSVEVGSIYPSWKHKLKLELPKLLRQGLLIVGGVGTGKTTTMLTLLIRIIRKIRELGGTPHILVIDKDGEYGSQELREAAGGKGNYTRIHVDEIDVLEFMSRDEYLRELLVNLGYYDRRTKAAKAIEVAVKNLHEESFTLTPDYVLEKILPEIQDVKLRAEIRSRIVEWKKKFENQQLSMPKYDISDIVDLLKFKTVVHIDLSATRDFDHAFKVLTNILRKIYSEALVNERFGCIIAIDEAHLFCPEKGGITLAGDEAIRSLRDTIHLIATTGPRNGVTPFIATQRPSLISKTITTQMGQNIIAHRVEDIDLARIEEIVGPIARKVRVLPRGWAIVKALAAKIREPLIVRVEAETTPESTGKTAYDRFLQ